MAKDFKSITIERSGAGFSVTTDGGKPMVYEDADSALGYLKGCLSGGHSREKGESSGQYARRAALDSYDKMEKKPV